MPRPHQAARRQAFGAQAPAAHAAAPQAEASQADAAQAEAAQADAAHALAAHALAAQAEVAHALAEHAAAAHAACFLASRSAFFLALRSARACARAADDALELLEKPLGPHGASASAGAPVVAIARPPATMSILARLLLVPIFNSFQTSLSFRGNWRPDRVQGGVGGEPGHQTRAFADQSPKRLPFGILAQAGSDLAMKPGMSASQVF